MYSCFRCCRQEPIEVRRSHAKRFIIRPVSAPGHPTVPPAGKDFMLDQVDSLPSSTPTSPQLFLPRSPHFTVSNPRRLGLTLSVHRKLLFRSVLTGFILSSSFSDSLSRRVIHCRQRLLTFSPRPISLGGFQTAKCQKEGKGLRGSSNRLASEDRRACPRTADTTSTKPFPFGFRSLRVVGMDAPRHRDFPIGKDSFRSI